MKSSIPLVSLSLLALVSAAPVAKPEAQWGYGYGGYGLGGVVNGLTGTLGGVVGKYPRLGSRKSRRCWFYLPTRT